MAWMPLSELAPDPDRNEDVVAAIAAIRDVLRTTRPEYLDASGVTVDADPDLRAAFFRLPHAGQDERYVEIRQGDGYTYLRSPVGEYHGHVPDEDFGEFIRAVLTGRLVGTREIRREVVVAERLLIIGSAGTRDLGRQVRWREAWRLLAPGGTRRRQRQVFSFEQPIAVTEA